MIVRLAEEDIVYFTVYEIQGIKAELRLYNFRKHIEVVVCQHDHFE